MDLNPTLKLAPQLVEAVLALEGQLSEGFSPCDLTVMRLRKRVRTLAADLKAALDAPQSFRPWTPHNTGNTQ
jgi:hypothetical protein